MKTLLEMYGTYSGTCTVCKAPPALSLDVLREATRSIRLCPFEEFANKHGFSLDGGDYMIVPKDLKWKIPERKGIVFSRFAEGIYLAKGDVLNLGLYSKDKPGKKAKK